MEVCCGENQRHVSHRGQFNGSLGCWLHVVRGFTDWRVEEHTHTQTPGEPFDHVQLSHIGCPEAQKSIQSIPLPAVAHGYLQKNNSSQELITGVTPSVTEFDGTT